MRLQRRFTISKEWTEPHLNEDASFVSSKRGLFALSDGASESFASRNWARTLVSLFVRTPNLTWEWIDSAIKLYEGGIDRNALSWSKQASYDRGSFATLLTVSLRENGAEIMSIGDSLVVIERNGVPERTYPYQNPDEFAARPLLLSTIKERNATIIKEDHTFFWPFEDDEAGVSIHMMTDALGAWLLHDLTERMRIIRGIRTQLEFEKFITEARTEGMRIDDTTLITIG
tara:strand:- start:1930 stop:2619 length:690 start_codon:yes stop_codon:yes gene_type:complete